MVREIAGAALREGDGAPRGGVAPVAAAVEEATEAAAGVAERNDGGEEVGHREDALAAADAPDDEDDGREDESAVEHEPALVDADDPLRVRGELRLPMLDHIREARADHAGDHQRDDERGEVASAAEAFQKLPAQEEADGHARAVGLQVEEANVDEIRVHRAAVSGCCPARGGSSPWAFRVSGTSRTARWPRRELPHPSCRASRASPGPRRACGGTWSSAGRGRGDAP